MRFCGCCCLPAAVAASMLRLVAAFSPLLPPPAIPAAAAAAARSHRHHRHHLHRRLYSQGPPQQQQQQQQLFPSEQELRLRVEAADAARSGAASVAVLGGGFAGMAVAYNLARFGAHVTLYDDREPGDGGASAVAAGMLHPLTPRGKLIWAGEAGLAAAMEHIEAATAALRTAGALPPGATSIITADRIVRPLMDEKAADAYARAAAPGAPGCQWLRWLTKEELQGLAPGVSEGARAGVEIRGALAVDARAYLRGLWLAAVAEAAARQRRCEWVPQRLTPAQALALTAPATSSPSTATFDAVVVAVGADIKAFPSLSGLPGLRLVRGQTVLLCAQPPTATTAADTSGSGRGGAAAAGAAAAAAGAQPTSATIAAETGGSGGGGTAVAATRAQLTTATIAAETSGSGGGGAAGAAAAAAAACAQGVAAAAAAAAAVARAQLTSAVLNGQYAVPGWHRGRRVVLAGATQEHTLYGDAAPAFTVDASQSSVETCKDEEGSQEGSADSAAERSALLGKVSEFYPAVSGAPEVARTCGVRVIRDRSAWGRIPIAGKVPGERRAWAVAALGARGLIHHALIGRCVAAAALCDDEALVPHQLRDGLVQT